MQAVRFVGVGRPPQIGDVPKPSPGPGGCGRCHACQLSLENYCENWARMDGFGGGLGLDGGMAEYMLVPAARLLVPLGGLSPGKLRR